ncbi:MAG: phosphatidate cytidylyltransferase [Gemmatimonadales bacterium]
MIPSNLVKRIAVALVAIPTLFFLVYLGGWYLTTVVAVFAVIGAAEFFGLAANNGVEPLRSAGGIIAGLIPVATYAAVNGVVSHQWLLAAAVTAVFVVGVGALNRGPDSGPLAAVSTTLLSAAYTGGLSSAIILLRHLPDAPSAIAATWIVFLPAALTWACDTLAMTGGSLIGGAKLAPRVSPNKTWAGAIIGGLGAVLLAPLYSRLFLVPAGVELSLVLLLTVGFVVGVLGQTGDLVESLFKREVGVKDSGTVFPGHGGVLDRLDSLYWVLPSTVIVFLAFGIV